MLLSDGGQNVKKRGFLLLENTYSGVPNLATPPNVNQIQTINGSGTGVYFDTRTALKAGTTYKVLAYAYGQEYSDSLNDLAVGYSDACLHLPQKQLFTRASGLDNTDGSACAAALP